MKKMVQDKIGTDRTSPKAIITDLLTSLILLLGAWGIESIKTNFPKPGPPGILLIILNISELTLLVYFIIELLGSIRIALETFDGLILQIKKSKTAKSVSKISRRVSKSKRKSLIKRLLRASFVTLAISIIALLIIWLVGKPINWTQVAIYSAILLAVSFFSSLSPGIDSGVGCGFLIQPILILALVISVIIVLMEKFHLTELITSNILAVFFSQMSYLFQVIIVLFSLFVILTLLAILGRKMINVSVQGE